MHIRFTKRFAKQRDKAPVKIRQAFDKRLVLFLQNPFHPLLGNHALKGEFTGYRSINITGDWQAIYSEQINVQTREETIVFEALGTHGQLYR